MSEAIHPAELKAWHQAHRRLNEAQAGPLAAVKAIEELIAERYELKTADKIDFQTGAIIRAQAEATQDAV